MIRRILSALIAAALVLTVAGISQAAGPRLLFLSSKRSSPVGPSSLLSQTGIAILAQTGQPIRVQ